MSDESTTVTVPYATPERRPSKTWAAASLLFGGLGLIFLGGCFMVGVMMLSSGSASPGASGPPRILLVFLLILALACFGGAIPLIILGVKSLLQIIRS